MRLLENTLRCALLGVALLSVSAGEALAGSVPVLNCFHNTVEVGAFYSNDAVTVWPYSSRFLKYNEEFHLSCAPSKCKVKVNSVLFKGPFSGRAMYHNGRMGPIGDGVACS